MREMRSKYFLRNWLAIFMGAIGSQTIYVLMANYSLIFFTDFLGVSAGATGLIFALSRVWDAVNDPMCGALIDKSNNRFGKTQPFMMGGGIIAAIFLVLLFTVPEFSLTGRTIWGIVNYNVAGMAFTAITVSILVQMPRASRDSKERVYLSVSYSIGGAITGIIVAVAVAKGISVLGQVHPEKGYQSVAIFSAVIGLLFLVGNSLLMKDQTRETGAKEENPKVRMLVASILHTPPFLIAVTVGCLINLGNGISAGALVYYVTYVLKNPGLVQVLLPLVYVGTFASGLLAGYFTRFGKITMCKISMIMIIFGYLGRIFTGDSNLIFTGICYTVAYLGNGFISTYLLPLLMDCADYTEYKTGVKCEALTMTGFTLCSKMAAGIGAAVLGFALQSAGYEGQSAIQKESAVKMISYMHLYSLVILAAVGFILLFLFRLDENTMEKVRAARNIRV